MDIDPAYSNSNVKIWRRLDSDELVYAPGFANREVKSMERCTELSQNGLSSNAVPKNYFCSADDALPQFGPKKFNANSLFSAKGDKLMDCDQSQIPEKECQLEARNLSEMMDTDSTELMEQERASKRQSGIVIDDVHMISPEVSVKENTDEKSDIGVRCAKRKLKRNEHPRDEKEHKMKTSLRTRSPCKKNNDLPLILSRPVRKLKYKTDRTE